MRSVLQTFAFVSTTLFTLLQAGLVVTSLTGRAAMGYSPATVPASCLACYSCTKNLADCTYTGDGRGCRDTFTCSCKKNNGNPICK